MILQRVAGLPVIRGHIALVAGGIFGYNSGAGWQLINLSCHIYYNTLHGWRAEMKSFFSYSTLVTKPASSHYIDPRFTDVVALL